MSATPTGSRAVEASHREAHRDAVVEPRVDRRAAGERRAAAAVDDEAVVRLLDADADRPRPAAIAGDPVRFLEPELGEAARAGRAARRRRRRRRGSDIRRSSAARSRAARRSPRSARVADDEVGDRLAVEISRWFAKAMSAPISRSSSNRPVRVGLTPTPSIRISEPGHDQGGDGEEGGGRGVAGNGELLRPQLGLAARARSRRPSPRRSRRRTGRASARRWSRVGAGSTISVMPGRVERRRAAAPI